MQCKHLQLLAAYYNWLLSSTYVRGKSALPHIGVTSTQQQDEGA